MLHDNDGRVPDRHAPVRARRRAGRRAAMSLVDAHGLAVSTGSKDALDAYERAIDSLLGGHGDASSEIGTALAADPDFVMGYALRAALLVMTADEAARPDLARTLRAAAPLRARANDRERRHLAAAHAWLERDLARAVRLYGEILVDYPRDSLALRAAHTGDFQLDQTALLHDRVARVLPYWNESLPYYGYVLGMYAFGLEENGHYAHAEDVGRRALVLNPRNPGAIHAVAHIMEMQGRSRDGIAWLDGTASRWTQSRAYASHLWWHRALCHFDLDQPRPALEIYDRHFRPVSAKTASTLVDASALLWRLHLRGVDVTQRWNVVADAWEAKPIDGLRPFNDVHAMLAFVATGRAASAQRLLRDLRKSAERSRTLSGAIRDAVLPVCEALLAFGRGDHAAAVERLTVLRHLIRQCGGSKAQCDLLHLTLLESALRARRRRLARALVSERIARKPASVINRHLQASAERYAARAHGIANRRTDRAESLTA